jgi:hypothetical protein
VVLCATRVRHITGIHASTLLSRHPHCLNHHPLHFLNADEPSKKGTGYVRAPPAKWKDSDGEIIFQAILDAKKHPNLSTVRSKEAGTPLIRSEVPVGAGAVTVPESE